MKANRVKSSAKMEHGLNSKVQFFLPESEDRVDPGYDFETDSYCEKRARGTDHDVYAHELLDSPNCDGLLVTRSIIGEKREAEILRKGGIHSFLRFSSESQIIGDCGAFQYRNDEIPPYTPAETLSFYDKLGFNFGITLDHMILEYDDEYDFSESLFSRSPSDEMRRRFEITVRNAKEMLRLHRDGDFGVKLIGSVQGWSPDSYHSGVRELIETGFDYLALGGLARASDEQIRSVLNAIKQTVLKAGAKLHVLGVARLSLLEDYVGANVVSCDSASALLQAFKSNKDNYHTVERNYTAVRIPPATGDLSPKVRKLLRTVESVEGEAAATAKHKVLIELEAQALNAIRDYAARKTDLQEAVKALVAYEDQFGDEKRYYPFFEETLRDRPWEECPCSICREIGVEVVILRGNNRNRRRGFHNIRVFYQQFKERREELAGESAAAS